MLTRSISDNNLFFDPEIGENQRNSNNMAQPERRTLGDFAMPDISGSFGGIVSTSKSS